MIIDLGESFASFEWVQVTAQYSNAVLLAVLPYISNVAERLDLPVVRPVTAEHVVHCSVLPNRRVAAEIGVSGGWVFAFDCGFVNTIQSDHAYSVLQDPDEIPQFYGQLNMSKAEAIELARDSLKKLGISLEAVFADQEPHVNGPHRFGTNLVPHYEIQWPDPRGGIAAGIEINGQVRRIERISFASKILERAPPKVAVVPPRDPRFSVLPRINPEYVRQVIPIVLRAIDDYGQKLSLPVPRPLITNHVARIRVQENYGGPYIEVELTNGWRFLYEHDMITANYAPDNLFSTWSKPLPVKQLLGKWKLTELEAIALVRATLAKLDYPTNLIHMDFEPQVNKPGVQGIPRFMFSWSYSLEGDSMVRSAVIAEVDADKGQLKSLYYGNQAFWGRKPPIDVPILLPPEAVPKPATNQTGKPRIATTNLHRPFPKAILR